MQRAHRRGLSGVIALLMAFGLLPLVPGTALATSDYLANCDVKLRASPSTSATSPATIATGNVVTVMGTVTGGSWSGTCGGSSLSGTSWYAVTAVDATSVSALYGVDTVYAASGLFRPAGIALEGVDVSKWQGTIDWPTVAASGKRFVVMKATEGYAYLDPTFVTNDAGAKAVGLPVSAYHFALPSSDLTDAVRQADWFVLNAALAPGDILPALDLEKTGGLDSTDLIAWVQAWLGEVYTQTGVRPMIYSSPNFWKNSMGDTTTFADQGYGVLWVAHWDTPVPTVPAGNWAGRGWTFWQYDNCGKVPGIPGCVDMDRYNGTDLSSVTITSVIAPPPPPAGPPILTSVTPSTVATSSTDVTLGLAGANFVKGDSTVLWNGIALATTFVSSTELQAIVPAAVVGPPGTAVVTVTNATSGGGSSAPVLVTVTAPPAQITVSPGTGVVAWGTGVTLDVQIATLGASRTVTLQRLQANQVQWSDLATLTTDATGHAMFSYRPPINTQFRAVFAGAPDLGPGTSPAARVVVRQLIVMRPTNGGQTRTVTAGTPVTFTGTIRPIGSGLAGRWLADTITPSAGSHQFGRSAALRKSRHGCPSLMKDARSASAATRAARAWPM